MRSVWLAIIGLLGATSLPAQATVVKPEPPLDSARASLRDAVLILGDSLITIDGAAARLQRDSRQTSGASLLSRARVMRDACARSVRAIPATREALLTAQLSEPARVTRRRELVKALEQLRAELNRCEADFAAMSRPGEGETVRGYSYARSEVVQAALRKYEESLRAFLTAMGINLSPTGSASPASSG